MQERNDVYDLMKGACILLMMVGHIPNIPDLLHQVIYSFHMPFFFMLAGYFAKPVSIFDGGKNCFVLKSVKRLLLPFVITSLFMILWGGVQMLMKHNVSYLMIQLCNVGWLSAGNWDNQWGSFCTGHIWFLWALLWGRIFIGWILNKSRYWWAWSLGAGFVATLLCSKTSWGVYVPFFILQGLSALPFMVVGQWIASSKDCWKWLLCTIPIWPPAIVYGGISMYGADYTCYPLDFLGAIGASIALYFVVYGCSKLYVSKTLLWCGKFSLVILCFHYFEQWTGIWFSVRCKLSFELTAPVEIMFRYGLTLLAAYASTKLPILKKVYR